MTTNRYGYVFAAFLMSTPSLVLAQPGRQHDAVPLKHWSAPAYFSSSIPEATVVTSSSLAFVGIVPCRLVDTRDSTLAPPFGQPVLSGGEIRTITVPSNNRCGIPSAAQAYSLNFTVVPRGPLQYLTAWPTPNRPFPEVSILNSYAGQVVANAAVVPAGTNGSFDMFATHTTDVIIDINGYYIPQPSSSASGMPPGTVVALAGDIIPSGWLLCDGSVFDRTNPLYAGLFNAIGTANGGDGSPNFRIPDYRGLFLRGVNRTLAPARDPEADSRVRPAVDGTGNPGNKVGSLQLDSFKGHNHGGGNHHHTTGSQNGAAPQFGGIIVRRDAATPPFDPPTSDSGTIINTEGGPETRPINAYVQFIIKL